MCVMCLYFFLLVSLKKEKKKHKTFNAVSQEATTNRWELAFDMKTFFSLDHCIHCLCVSFRRDLCMSVLCEVKSFKCFVSAPRRVGRKPGVTFPKLIWERRFLPAVLSRLLPTPNPSAKAHFTRVPLRRLSFPLVCQGHSFRRRGILPAK